MFSWLSLVTWCSFWLFSILVSVSHVTWKPRAFLGASPWIFTVRGWPCWWDHWYHSLHWPRSTWVFSEGCAALTLWRLYLYKQENTNLNIDRSPTVPFLSWVQCNSCLEQFFSLECIGLQTEVTLTRDPVSNRYVHVVRLWAYIPVRIQKRDKHSIYIGEVCGMTMFTFASNCFFNKFSLRLCICLSNKTCF